MVSSQFSIHYYFETEQTFGGFLENVKDNIKKGGYFIGTCYDGRKIYEHFKEINDKRAAWKAENDPDPSSEESSEESSDDSSSFEANYEDYSSEYKEFKYVDTNSNKVFSVEKDYDLDTFDYNPDDISNIGSILSIRCQLSDISL